MVHYVYILECVDENGRVTLYVGYTSRSPEIRLKDHLSNVKSNNKRHYTSRQKVVRLVYYEVYEDRQVALVREREIKKLGSRYKQGLVDGVKRVSKDF